MAQNIRTQEKTSRTVSYTTELAFGIIDEMVSKGIYKSYAEISRIMGKSSGYLQTYRYIKNDLSADAIAKLMNDVNSMGYEGYFDRLFAALFATENDRTRRIEFDAKRQDQQIG